MEVVIYINQNNIKIAKGHTTQDGYYVKSLEEVYMKYNETQPQQFTNEFINIMHDKNIDQAILVLSTKDISWKTGEIPQTKSLHLAREIVKRELEEITDSNKEYVYDFRLMKKQDKVGQRVLMFALEKEKIEFYINLFKQAHIKLTKITVSLNSVIRVYEHVFCHKHPTMAIISIEKKEVNTFLFIEEKFRYFGKDSISDSKDSLTLRNELINRVSQVIQFQRGNFRNNPLKDIIFIGMDKQDFSVLKGTFENLFQVHVKSLNEYQLLDKRSQKSIEECELVILGALKEWS